MSRRDRFFHEHRRIRLQGFDGPPGQPAMDTSVEIHTDADIRPHCFAHQPHPFRDLCDALRAVDPRHPARGVHLDCAESLLHPVLRGFRHPVGAVAPYPAVYRDAAPHRAAKQFIDRGVQRFALDVPQCLIDTRYGAHQHRPAPIESAPVEDLPDVLDAVCGPPDHIFAQFLDSSPYGAAAPLDDRFAPADKSSLCGDFQKKPAGRYVEQLERFNNEIFLERPEGSRFSGHGMHGINALRAWGYSAP